MHLNSSTSSLALLTIIELARLHPTFPPLPDGVPPEKAADDDENEEEEADRRHGPEGDLQRGVWLPPKLEQREEMEGEVISTSQQKFVLEFRATRHTSVVGG